MKLYILLFFTLMFFSCKHDKSNAIINDAYKTEFSTYRENLSKERVNYLQLVGLFKLDAADNTFGKDSINDFTLNINALPKTIGSVSVLKDDLLFNASKNVIVKTKEDSIISSMSLKLDSYGSSIKLYHKQLNWQVITRAGQKYLRVWDIKNPAIEAFKGFYCFELNLDYILEGEFTYFEKAKTEAVHSQLGVNTDTNFIGVVTFNFNGETHSLDVGQDGFTMVSDDTTGDSTYGGGRYIYLNIPETNGSVTLDFNRLYNPPCSFSEFTTCLYPPRQNVLPFKILAGEKIDLKR